MKADLRTEARQALARAKGELAAQKVERIKYAALELRFAMEAVTYDRALAVKDEIPPEEYRTWQPRKLMQLLHDIDPTLGMSATIAVGIEKVYGEQPPPEDMQLLGTDRVFTLADLKAHYDAVGSYLHIPSLAQMMKSGMPDQEKLRVRCEALIVALEEILASPVWNSTLGAFTEFQCRRCQKPVRKRIPLGKEQVEATCFECKAEYLIASQEGGQTLTQPKTVEVACGDEACAEKLRLWPDELKPGTHWTCKGCGEHWGLAYGVFKLSEDGKPVG